MKQGNFSTFFVNNLGFFLILFLSNVFLNSYELFLEHHNISARALFISDLLKYFKNFFVAALLSFIFVYLAYLSKNHYKKVIFILFILNYCCFIIDYFLISHFNSFLNQFILDSLFRTNSSESLEFIKNYFSLSFVLCAALFLIIQLALLKIKIKLQVAKKINKILCSILILLSLVTVLDMIKKYHKTQLLSYSFVRLESFNITRILCAFLYYKESAFVDYKALVNEYKNMYLSKEKISAKNNIKNIILILGESLNKNKMSLYGGGYLTNPYLSKLQKNGNLIAFLDVIAPYSSTNPVMQTILNFSNYENTDEKHPWHSYFDVIGLFKLASYETFFISNQEGFGMWGNAAASIGSNALNVYFSNQGKNSIRYMNFRPDSVLFEYINNIKLKEKNFIIIHLMGSHFIYDYRYENNFKKYKAADIKSNLDEKKRKKIASYYNSILYNDYIINSIYERFAKDDSLILYLSDHAESLYDDKTKSVLGHSIIDKTNAEIPFIFIFSDTFKQKHNNLLVKIQNAVNKAYMSDDLIHTLCDLAGLNYYECDEKRSIINENYNDKRKRLFHNVDYDKFLK